MQVRSYSTKSNAHRMLKQLLDSEQVPSNLIRHRDGKFHIDMAEVEDYLSLYPKAKVKAAPTPVPMPIQIEVIAKPAVSASGKVKPFVIAKKIVLDMFEKGKSRKEIIAACMEAGIKYNTADNAHYTLCVKARS